MIPHIIHFAQSLDLISFGARSKYNMEHDMRLRIYQSVNSESLVIYRMNKLLFLVSIDTKTTKLVKLPN